MTGQTTIDTSNTPVTQNEAPVSSELPDNSIAHAANTPHTAANGRTKSENEHLAWDEPHEGMLICLR